MARLTKAMRYKLYGVTWEKDHVQTPMGNWVSMPLADGNEKVGKSVKTWSVMHGNELYTLDNVGNKVKAVMQQYGITECKGSCELHCAGCYCDSGNYTRYNDVYARSVQWLTLYRLYPDWVESVITAQIEIENVKQVRIHAQGDFSVNDNYIAMWTRICRHCTNCVFWTYTKIQAALDAFRGIDNLFITPSITPYGFNFGTCTELLYKYNKLVEDGYKVHVCKCGTDKNWHCETCNHGCKAVGKECDYVLFIKHSTKDYKAGKNDPEQFAAVKAIIENQVN